MSNPPINLRPTPADLRAEMDADAQARSQTVIDYVFQRVRECALERGTLDIRLELEPTPQLLRFRLEIEAAFAAAGWAASLRHNPLVSSFELCVRPRGSGPMDR